MSKSESERTYTEHIGLKLTEEQKRELRVEAAKNDMSMGAFVRQQIFDDE
jgi:predicted HicB family RNase H-like nuclease